MIRPYPPPAPLPPSLFFPSVSSVCAVVRSPPLETSLSCAAILKKANQEIGLPRPPHLPSA